MDPNRRTRTISTIGIVALIGILLFVGYRMIGGFSVTARSVFGGSESERGEPRRSVEARGALVELAYDRLTGFTNLSADGGWRIRIAPGDYRVTVRTSERLVDEIDVTVRGRTLRLDVRPGFRSVTGTMEATVFMPSIERIEIDGGADVRLTEFQSDRLKLDVDGAATVVGVDVRVEVLEVNVDGAARIDFGESRVVNARVDLDGAASLSVAMAGGELVGTLAGVGSVAYSGEVSRESIDVEGLGTVRRK